MRIERERIHEERARLKAEFGALYGAVSRILFRHDPIEIGFDGNEDEYEPEVDTILPRLGGCESREEVRRVVHEEFLAWFDAESVGGPERYEEIAAEIWSAWVGALVTTRKHRG